MNISVTLLAFLAMASLSFILMTFRRFYQKNQQLAPQAAVWPGGRQSLTERSTRVRDGVLIPRESPL
jgi:hypothetical protein